MSGTCPQRLAAVVHRVLLGLGALLGLAGCPDREQTTEAPAARLRGPQTGTVTRVSDGDTLWLRLTASGQRVKVRLHGIDTPERAQPFGPKATAFVRKLALHRPATARPVTRDRYRRLVARVVIDGQDLGSALLSAGLAWHYVRYSKDARYAALVRAARQARRGLWAQEKPTPPWEFRRAQRRR